MCAYLTKLSSRLHVGLQIVQRLVTVLQVLAIQVSTAALEVRGRRISFWELTDQGFQGLDGGHVCWVNMARRVVRKALLYSLCRVVPYLRLETYWYERGELSRVVSLFESYG